MKYVLDKYYSLMGRKLLGSNELEGSRELGVVDQGGFLMVICVKPSGQIFFGRSLGFCATPS